jgi:hypothetical protein
MKNFEKRVALTLKSENFQKTIEDLESNYSRRENFTFNNINAKTSEICTPPPFFACVVGLFVAFGAIAVTHVAAGIVVEIAAGVHQYAGCYTEVLPCNDYASVDFYTYKNVV